MTWQEELLAQEGRLQQSGSRLTACTKRYVYVFACDPLQPHLYCAREPRLPQLAANSLTLLAERVATLLHDRAQDHLDGYFLDWYILRIPALEIDGALYLRAARDKSGQPTGKPADWMLFEASDPISCPDGRLRAAFADQVHQACARLEQFPSAARRQQDACYRAACEKVAGIIAKMHRDPRRTDVTVQLAANHLELIRYLARQSNAPSCQALIEAWLWHGLRIQLLMVHPEYERGFSIPWQHCRFRHPDFAWPGIEPYDETVFDPLPRAHRAKVPVPLNLPYPLVHVAATLPLGTCDGLPLARGIPLEKMIWKAMRDHHYWFVFESRARFRKVIYRPAIPTHKTPLFTGYGIGPSNHEATD